MAEKTFVEKPTVRIGTKLGIAFDQLQDRIRERAYHLSSIRDPHQGDAISDWLNAQVEFVSPIELVVKEQRKNIVVEGNLKGFSPQEIEVEIQGDVLKVLGSHTESSSKEEGAASTLQSQSVCFFQAIQLPDAVNLDESSAKLFKNGKLKVTLPRRLTAKS